MTFTAPAPLQTAGPFRGASARVDIVVPVYNEAAALEDSIRRLHDFLQRSIPFSLADRDRRQRQHRRHARDRRALAVELWHVDVLRLQAKGRGRALRAAWSASDADVLCYMDVDLSTDLRALLAAGRPAALAATATWRSGPGWRRAPRSCAGASAS